MLSHLNIFSRILGDTVLFAYLTVLLFGGGLHLHESLNHEHQSAPKHSHEWVAHVHENTGPLNLHGEIVVLAKDIHDHQVSLLEITAISVFNSLKHSHQDAGSDHFDLLRNLVPQPPTSVSLIFLHETSPPRFSQLYYLDLGRSPPTA